VRPHRFPTDAPSEVYSWRCAACGEWISDTSEKRTECPVNWRETTEAQENQLLGRAFRRFICDSTHGRGWLETDAATSVRLYGWVDVEPDELALLRRLSARRAAL
jgi:hypothetical protein